MEKKSILKGAGVLLIAAIMILSTVAVTANTNEQKVMDAAESLTLEQSETNNLKLSLASNMGTRDMFDLQFSFDKFEKFFSLFAGFRNNGDKPTPVADNAPERQDTFPGHRVSARNR